MGTFILRPTRILAMQIIKEIESLPRAIVLTLEEILSSGEEKVECGV